MLTRHENYCAIKCRFNELYFEIFHRIFLLFYIHMEVLSVISMRCFIYLTLLPLFDSDLTQKLVQRACYKNYCSNFYSFYDQAIPFHFRLFLKIFIFTVFILVTSVPPAFIWYWEFTTMILWFALNKRTIYGHGLFLDVFFFFEAGINPHVIHVV